MNYGVILAGGTGSRMKKINIPKQYYEIGGIPIIVYTLRKLIEVNIFDYIYIAVSNDYLEFVSELINKYFPEKKEKFIIVIGGRERIHTIHNVIEKIKCNKISADDVIVIHDAVRPFVTNKILIDSVNGARQYGATVAAIPVSDTILNSSNGDYVESIPVRSVLYNGQAPDSFNLRKFIELESMLTDEQKRNITGTSQVCTMNNFPIKMIEGDAINFKITTDADLIIAKRLILNKDGE